MHIYAPSYACTCVYVKVPTCPFGATQASPLKRGETEWTALQHYVQPLCHFSPLHAEQEKLFVPFALVQLLGHVPSNVYAGVFLFAKCLSGRGIAFFSSFWIPPLRPCWRCNAALLPPVNFFIWRNALRCALRSSTTFAAQLVPFFQRERHLWQG